MKILLIGSGGREHALGLRMLQDESVEAVYVYPGNAGMKERGLHLVPCMDASFQEALRAAKNKKIDWVMIGPEWPLYQGWVDQFNLAGIPAFGPTQAASFLEESKIKSKNFMIENQIPTARYQVAYCLEDAVAAIRANSLWAGYVLKMSGPALGKGVVVTRNSTEALLTAEKMFTDGAKDGVVIEELIAGREVSLFYACMNESYQFLSSACDHKRLKDRDEGPNTGGMGAYSPATWINSNFLQNVEEKFVKPTLSGMKKRGTPFQGILFLGLMVKNGDPYLLEYNVRFGDPETQAILPRLDGNFSGMLHSIARGDETAFKGNVLTENHLYSMHIVKAAKGYPGKVESGKKIEGDAPEEQFYFAGVREVAGRLVTSGGRVLGLTVLAESIAEARDLAYEKIHKVKFEGEHFRTDIGANP